MASLQPIRPTTLKLQAGAAVRSAIFHGQFRPGDPLRELHLARDLKVSQPTIREALLDLEREGLVIRTPNVGTIVRNMSRTEVKDRLEVRRHLETMAAVSAAAQMTNGEFSALERLRDDLNVIPSGGSPYDVAQADFAFHRHIWKCSGNTMLMPTLELIAAPLFAFVSVLCSTGQGQFDHAGLAHEPIVAALRRKDPARIERALAKHLEHSYEDFLESGAPDCRTYAAGIKESA